MIDMFDIVLLFTTFVVGLCMVTVPFVIEEKRAYHTGLVVKARIKGCKKIKKIGALRTYLIWEYKYQDKTYIHRSRRGHINETRKTNDWGIVVVDRKNPSKVYELMTYKEKIMFRAIGFFLMILPAICLCIMEILK